MARQFAARGHNVALAARRQEQLEDLRDSIVAAHPKITVSVHRLDVIDPEQVWFWTREWQAKEREADEDLAAGRATTYESDDEFLGALEDDMKPLDADS